MSAELALTNQLLVRALKVNAGAGDTTFKVPVNSGSLAIEEGDAVQIDPNGLAYPSGFKEDATNAIITSETKAQTYYPIASEKLWLSNDAFVAYGGTDSSAYLVVFKLNTDTNLFEMKNTLSLSTTYQVSGHYAKLCLGAEGTNEFFAYYNTSATNVRFTRVGYNPTTFALTNKDSANLSHNSYSYMSTIAKLDATRYMVMHYNSGGSYIIFALTSPTTWTASSWTSLPAPFNNMGYINNWTANGHTMFWSNTTSYPIGSVKPNTGTNVVFGDISSQFSEVDKLALANIPATGISYAHWRDTDEFSFFTPAYYGVNEEIDNAFCKLTSPSSGQFKLTYFKPALHTLALGRINYSKLIKTSVDTYYIYNTNTDNTSGYGHKIYKMVVDTLTKTYTMTRVVDEPFSNATMTSQPGVTNTITINSQGDLVAGSVMASPYTWDTVKIGGDAVNYAATELIAAAPIAANSQGVCITEAIAFEHLGANPGSNYLNKFIITDTNYAVKLK